MIKTMMHRVRSYLKELEAEAKRALLVEFLGGLADDGTITPEDLVSIGEELWDESDPNGDADADEASGEVVIGIGEDGEVEEPAQAPPKTKNQAAAAREDRFHNPKIKKPTKNPKLANRNRNSVPSRRHR